jgi:hypothetical protein
MTVAGRCRCALGAEDIWELAKKKFTAELKDGRAKWKSKMRDCQILIKLVSS